MNRMRFGQMKLPAIVAALAIALGLSIRPSSATVQPPSTTAPGADLANEARVLAKYSDDLFAFDKEVLELGKRARLVGNELDPVLRKSDTLKGRLPEVQNAVREIVRKLKATNEWDDLNASFAKKISYTDARRSFLLQTSFKQSLEEFSNANYRNDIDSPLDDLRKRLTSHYLTGGDFQIVRAGYAAPASALYFEKLQCGLGKLRLKVVVNNGGLPADDVWRNVWINCNVGQACCPFTN